MAGCRSDEENVVLIVGSLGLDRLLTVPRYPKADSKVRTTSYYEEGGGNAGNTSCAMALLRDAKLFGEKNIQIKLLTKVGDDSVGQQLTQELESFNVNISSPLFLKGPPGSTTSFTTIIVSSNIDEHEQPTRTCLHTPGTCGNLTIEDALSVDLDEVFHNVVHLHSDSRHAECSLFLAKEAKKRGISISCDIEKDRSSKALDELIGVSDMLFTNSSCLIPHLERLDSELETERNREPLPKPVVKTKDSIETSDAAALDVYSRSFTPSAFFSRWYLEPKKHVIVTHGEFGALHFETTKISHVSSKDVQQEERRRFAFNEIDMFQVGTMLHVRNSCNDTAVHCQSEHSVRQVGILRGTHVVDTTGAGDAFIGGYILAKLFGPSQPDDDDVDPIQFALSFGAWVAGRKVAGPGPRSALPKGKEVDKELGNTKDAIQKALVSKLSPFKCV